MKFVKTKNSFQKSALKHLPQNQQLIIEKFSILKRVKSKLSHMLTRIKLKQFLNRQRIFQF